MNLVKTIKSNLLLIIGATILLVAIGFLVGKAVSNNQDQLDALQFKYSELEKATNDKDKFIGLLNEELFQINTNLNSISFDSIAMTGLDDPQAKINFLDSLLEQSSQRILKLESMVANDKSGQTAKLLQTIINDLEYKLLEKETLISQLSIENEKLVDDNNILARKVSNLSDSENALRDDIAAQMKSLNKLKDELSESQDNLKKSYTSAQLEKAEIFFNKGMEKLNEFESLKAKKFKIAKKLKREYINEAYKNFKAACENGHPEASQYIYNLLKTNKYNKHLNIDSSGSGLGDCGI